jgi:hypothetical protein
VVLLTGPAPAQETLTTSPSAPWVGLSSTPVVSPAVRDLPDAPAAETGRKLPPRRNPRPDLTGVLSAPALEADPLLQKSASARLQAPPPLL